METKITLDGHDLKAMFTAGTDWLERIVPDINALNVYPVPDGDCGTNMLLTMRASLAEAGQSVDGVIGCMAEAIARGALMGARGNSGVILSQIWRGLHQNLKGKNTISAGELAQAFDEAAETAYRALSNPVEGTILTVMRDAAAAARQAAAESDATPVTVLEAAVNAARASVVNTPNLLDVLKEAGVVDAGGHGLFTLMEGALFYLKGDMENHSLQLIPCQRSARPAQISNEEESYGFCTQFLVRGGDADVAKLRGALEEMGKSLIVVGDGSAVRVHIHTLAPDTVTKIASSFGTLSDIDVRDMDEQHKEFVLVHQEKLTRESTAVVAVVNGDGLTGVFSDLGVCAVIPGGQSMNPSTIDILQTIEAVPSDNVILLPNNKNVIPTALLVQSLTKKRIRVIPSRSIPQGIAAMIAFVPESDFEDNAEQMNEAVTSVRTIEVTRATRATSVNKLDIKEGQFIALLDDELLAADDNAERIVLKILSRIGLKAGNLVSVYYGKDTSPAEAEKLCARIGERYPGVQVGVVNGGQPSYDYIISAE